MFTVDKIKKKLYEIIFNENKEVDYINGSESLPSPLEKEMEDYYIEEFSKGSRFARNKLIEHNLRLVVYVARKYDTSIANLEDLISIGTIGLVKAIETFKNNKNIKLATYASRCIENEILMHLRKRSRSKLEVSLDEPLNIDYDGNELLLADILSSDENEITDKIEQEEKRNIMLEAISTLSNREKEILNLRYGLVSGEEMTQKDVADFLGISQSYISRLEKRIIKKLKMQLNK
jgi:RNA polymerase sporulation-specific sigma factor